MAICKHCGIGFHACGSCDLNTNYEYDYCSSDCWEKSKEFTHNKFLVQKFYILLNEKQRILFREILEIDVDGDYEQEVKKWMKTIDDHQDQVNKGKWNG